MYFRHKARAGTSAKLHLLEVKRLQALESKNKDIHVNFLQRQDSNLQVGRAVLNVCGQLCRTIPVCWGQTHTKNAAKWSADNTVDMS